MDNDQYNQIPEQLLKSFYGGKVVLFIGAGCSMSVGLPDWKTLLEQMVEDFRMCKRLPIETECRLAECFGNRERYKEIAQILQDCDSQQYYCSIQNSLSIGKDKKGSLGLHLPKYLKKLGEILITESWVHSIITTNFDLVIEESISYIHEEKGSRDRGWDSFTWKNESPYFLNQLSENKDRFVFHIHGRIDEVETLIHTTKEYEQLDEKGSAAKQFFSRLFEKYTFLFIGYSVGDPVISWVKQKLKDDWGVVPENWYNLVPLIEVTEVIRTANTQSTNGSNPVVRVTNTQSNENNPTPIFYTVRVAGCNIQYTGGLDRWFEQLYDGIEQFQPRIDKPQFALIANSAENGITKEGIIQYIGKHHQSVCRVFRFNAMKANREKLRNLVKSCIAVIIIHRAAVTDNIRHDMEMAFLAEIKKYLAWESSENVTNKILVYSHSPDEFSGLAYLGKVKVITFCCHDIEQFIIQAIS